jgi:hypothetical protein
VGGFVTSDILNLFHLDTKSCVRTVPNNIPEHEMIHWFVMFVFLFVPNLCIKYNDQLCQTASQSWSPQVYSSVNLPDPLTPDVCPGLC